MRKRSVAPVFQHQEFKRVSADLGCAQSDADFDACLLRVLGGLPYAPDGRKATGTDEGARKNSDLRKRRRHNSFAPQN